jgi:acyl carrier protein
MAENRDKILSRIEGVLSDLELLEGKGQLDENTGLLGKGIGLDSIEIIQLVAALEEEFELTIDDNDLLPDHFQSLGDLINFLQGSYLK